MWAVCSSCVRSQVIFPSHQCCRWTVLKSFYRWGNMSLEMNWVAWGHTAKNSPGVKNKTWICKRHGPCICYKYQPHCLSKENAQALLILLSQHFLKVHLRRKWQGSGGLNMFPKFYEMKLELRINIMIHKCSRQSPQSSLFWGHYLCAQVAERNWEGAGCLCQRKSGTASPRLVTWNQTLTTGI